VFDPTAKFLQCPVWSEARLEWLLAQQPKLNFAWGRFPVRLPGWTPHQPEWNSEQGLPNFPDFVSGELLLVCMMEQLALPAEAKQCIVWKP